MPSLASTSKDSQEQMEFTAVTVFATWLGGTCALYLFPIILMVIMLVSEWSTGSSETVLT